MGVMCFDVHTVTHCRCDSRETTSVSALCCHMLVLQVTLAVRARILCLTAPRQGVLHIADGSIDKAVECIEAAIKLEPGREGVGCVTCGIVVVAVVCVRRTPLTHTRTQAMLTRTSVRACVCCVECVCVGITISVCCCVKRCVAVCACCYTRVDSHTHTHARSQGRMEEALVCYRRSLASDPHNDAGGGGGGGGGCDCVACACTYCARSVSHARAGHNLMLSMNYVASVTADELFRAHVEWGDR
jgi:hypothetical protein